jgi:acetylornithine deacetylase/succinyl-diaminopimelate desuccinylase-like protein
MSAESYLAENQNRFIAELMEFIAIPSVSADPKAGAEMARAADWVVARLTRAGVERARVVPTAGHPVVMGEWLHAPGAPTVLIYGGNPPILSGAHP